MDLYRGVSDGIADGIAIENDNTVYIVDSGKDNGKLDFGVRMQRTINDARLRRDFIRRTNDNTVSNGNISDELLERLGYGVSSDSGRDLRRESGSELQADTRKPENNQSGISQENADSERGLKDGKASRELEFIDYLSEKAESEGREEIEYSLKAVMEREKQKAKYKQKHKNDSPFR